MQKFFFLPRSLVDNIFQGDTEFFPTNIGLFVGAKNKQSSPGK